MRIAMVSTYPPIECGIATYAQHLTDALRKENCEVFILSQHGGSGKDVIPSFSNGTRTIGSDVFEMVNRITPDVIHIQHEFGLYGEQCGVQVLDIIVRCHLANLPVVTTLHTVRQKLDHAWRVILRLIQQESTAVVVHQDYEKDLLADFFGTGEKVHVIPHGVRQVKPLPNAKARLGLEGRDVILLCGYLRRSKQLERVVKVFPQVAQACPNAVLVVANKPRTVIHDEYETEFYQTVENSPVRDRIRVFHGQFPSHVFDGILSAADVVALPYAVGAQSGIMSNCFAFGVPVVVSDLPAFRLWVERSGGGIIASSDEELVQSLIKILQDREVRSKMKSNIRAFVNRYASWTNVARQYCELYRKLIVKPVKDSQFIHWPKKEEER